MKKLLLRKNMKYIITLSLMFIGNVYSSTTDKIDVDISTNGFFSQNSVGLLNTPFKIKNLNNKTIKYMTIETLAFNKVGDLLTPYPGNNKCKVTGPIEYNKEESINSGCGGYYNSIISRLEIRVTSVEYMNGEINTNPTDFFTDMKSEDVYMKETMPIVLIGSAVGGLLLSLMLGIF